MLVDMPGLTKQKSVDLEFTLRKVFGKSSFRWVQESIELE